MNAAENLNGKFNLKQEFQKGARQNLLLLFKIGEFLNEHLKSKFGKYKEYVFLFVNL
ncbi:hypothetical protein I6U48_00915 [Clostridium sp. PL3]|uniref:Uncharacterized protein n=1 Tax=Clostridium thailandense TaxID=2794346 RepID=A0A949TQP8_9CLOT|nr:hypothetical protein [Clostridium thailandense]MBV7271481.1 hypothetical protein [Clostridium thailandense]